jgi:hypothetical protein
MSGLLEERVGDIVAMLPDDLNENELAAFLLTVVSAFAPSRTSGLTLLVTSTMTYAQVLGVTNKQLASIFRQTAGHLEAHGFAEMTKH